MALISLKTSDRVGLISDLAARLNDLGVNLGDAGFAVLGSTADFSSLAEVPDDVTLAQVRDALISLGGIDADELSVTPQGGSAAKPPETAITHCLTVSGRDRPGLVARLCEVLVEFKANIVQMNASTFHHADGDRYAVRFEVYLPPERAAVALAALANTAEQMGLDWESEAL
ncbi:MAG: glycine cleavage system protein R [Magnetovibrionaceae bacterium]